MNFQSEIMDDIREEIGMIDGDEVNDKNEL